MIGKLIVSRFSSLTGRFRLKSAPRPDLRTAWRLRSDLPQWVKNSPVAQRYLELLGPLAWDHLPERNLRRNWGQTTIPYASFIAAYLVKLNEGQDSLGDLRLYLSENPQLVWLLGFPLVISNPGKLAPWVSLRTSFDANASLPTTRHLTHMLRTLPNAALQFLLAGSVRLIREELATRDIQIGKCISLDTVRSLRPILAWVKDYRLRPPTLPSMKSG